MKTRLRKTFPPVTVRARRAATALARLVRIMSVLRSPRGCPWDRAQTHASLRPHLLEETYEAVEAIDRGDLDALAGELGDVLLQCVFHAQLAAERGRFDLEDVIGAITRKLIRRHPHVFTPTGRPLAPRAHRASGIRTAAAVKQQWEQIKAGEPGTGAKARVLAGIPRSLPALQRAHEIGRRAAAVGFDWTEPAGVLDKVDEEVRELRAAVTEGRGRVAEEFGDVLFSLASLARKLGFEPESALRAANDKFTRRFEAVETALERRGTSVHQADSAALDRAWRDVKAREPKGRPRQATSVKTRRHAPRPRARVRERG